MNRQFVDSGRSETRPSVRIIREAAEEKEREIAEKRHPFLKNPGEWICAHKDIWQSSFREGEPQSVVIGCADRRVGHRANLRYPGLGIVEEDFDKATKKIIDFLKESFRGRKAVLLSHDDCKATEQALKNHHGDKRDVDTLAIWWGEELAARINQRLEAQTVRHEHLNYRDMKEEQDPIEVIYVDCTDRFNPDEKLAHGPTISLLNPGGVKFSTGVKLRNIFGNGLQHHLFPELDCIIRHACGGESAQYSAVRRFSHASPLTIVLIYDQERRMISDTAQDLIQEIIRRHGQHIRIVPIDEKGTIRELSAH